MRLPFESFQLPRFARRQQSFIAIAVAIYLAMWAVDRPAPIGATLLYTLTLCNVVVLMQDHLEFLYTRKRLLYTWLLYMPLLLVGATLGVMAVNMIEFPAHHRPGQTLWQFLASGWKMPLIATMIVGVSSQLYRQTRELLEAKNRDLQLDLKREAAVREQQEQELEQAREIQQSLLPKEIPQVPGFEIECAWEPARIVGGDYFDVIRLSDSKLGICIADVVGKGVSAALLMANVQASVRAFARDSVSPAVLCSRLNSVLCSSVTTGKFVTFFYGVLESESGTLHYANGGHLHPILLDADAHPTRLENGGALLGIFPSWLYEDSVVRLRPGDRLLLFTDGITEAALPDGEEFGEQRLIECARQRAGKSTAELKTRLLDAVKRFCDSQLSDDATLIVISALPPVSAGATRDKSQAYAGMESL
jgi:sigma-B regulation protein RsbU (phosphoserine phosphatase)